MNSFVQIFTCGEHPSLEGHFPGNPILPGVVLLEEVLLASKSWIPAHQVVGLQAVKFHQPVRPGDIVKIELTQLNLNQARFRCKVDQQLISGGIILWRVSSK